MLDFNDRDVVLEDNAFTVVAGEPYVTVLKKSEIKGPQFESIDDLCAHIDIYFLQRSYMYFDGDRMENYEPVREENTLYVDELPEDVIFDDEGFEEIYDDVYDDGEIIYETEEELKERLRAEIKDELKAEILAEINGEKMGDESETVRENDDSQSKVSIDNSSEFEDTEGVDTADETGEFLNADSGDDDKTGSETDDGESIISDDDVVEEIEEIEDIIETGDIEETEDFEEMRPEVTEDPGDTKRFSGADDQAETLAERRRKKKKKRRSESTLDGIRIN
jgi:hypothetical protein